MATNDEQNASILKKLDQMLSRGVRQNGKGATKLYNAGVKVLDAKQMLGMTEEEYVARLTALRDRYLSETTQEWAKATASIYKHKEKAADEEHARLDLLRDLGLIKERDYYAALTDIRDRYLVEGSNAWLSYTADIITHHTDSIKASFKELSDYAGDQLNAVLNKQSALLNKFYDDASFYRTVTIHNAYEDGSSMRFLEPKDWARDLETLTRYDTALSGVKERIQKGGYDASYAKRFLDELYALSVDDALALSESLLMADDAAFSRHLSGYIAYQKKAEEVSEGQFLKEREEAEKAILVIEQGVNDAIKNAQAAALGSMAETLKEAGVTIPEGFYDIGEDAAAYFTNGFSAGTQALYQDILDAFSGVTVSNGLEVTGANGTTTYKTFSPTYNFYGNSETTQERIRAAQNASVREKLTGGY